MSYSIFIISFFAYIKMYKIIKNDYKKKLVKDINVFLRKKKKKKQQYGREWYKNLPEDKKQKLAECRKIHYKMRKIALL